MNLLANITGYSYYTCGLSKAIRELNADKLVTITMKQPGFDLKKCNPIKNIVLENVKEPTYRFKDDFEFPVIPVDTELLKAFEPYALNALKMMERLYVTSVTGVIPSMPDFDTRIFMLLSHLEFWNSLIEHYNINLYVDAALPHEVYNYIIYSLCKIKKIKTYFIYQSCVSGYSYFADDICTQGDYLKITFEKLQKEYLQCSEKEILLEGDFKDLFEKMTASKTDKTPEYMKKSVYTTKEVPKISFKHVSIVKRLSNIFRLFKNEGIVKSLKNWWNTQLFANRNIANYNKEANEVLYFYMKYWEEKSSEADLTQKFIYFPLHYQPECTTCPMGDYFVWQELAVKMISACLPDDVYIYVKENPFQTKRGRTLEFCDTLSSLKNVKLISQSVDTYKLIENCIAVATITGTALWEGAFSGKPGIIFGEYIYDKIPGIYKVSTNEQCQQVIDLILSETNQGPTKKDLKLYLLALSKTTMFIYDDRNCPQDNVPHEVLESVVYNAYTKMFKHYNIT